MCPTIRNNYKYFHSTVQRAKDRRKDRKFHFCRLPFDVRPCNVKLNLSYISTARLTCPGTNSIHVEFDARRKQNQLAGNRC